jgi:uncharacterized protein
MPRLLIFGGSGFLGRYLTNYYLANGWDVVIIARHQPQPFDGARFVAWDGQTLGDWARELENADAVINLAGRSVNCRYTTENKRQIYASRLESTALIAKAIANAQNPPPVWLNSSSATIYRHAHDRAMNETSGEIGSGFSVDVCQKWEHALFETTLPKTRRVAMRLAMTFGAGKASVWEAFATLVRLGFGGPMAGGKQFVSWVHVRDFVRATHWLIEHPALEGAVNISSPHPLPNAQFLSALRRALHVPYALPVAQWQLELGAFAMGTETELLLKSRRVVPQKLLDSGFEFEFPKWEKAARDVAKSQGSR